MMKKNFYLLTMLMLGLSVAVWTGCSDDNKETPTPEPPVNPTPPDTVPVISKAFVGMADAMDGSWIKDSLIIVDGKLTTLKTWKGQAETSEADYTGSFAFTYQTGKVVVNYTDETNKGCQMTYLLNAQGNADSATIIRDNDLTRPICYKFAYNANGMLEKFGVMQIDENQQANIRYYLTVALGADKNWNSYAIFDLGEVIGELECTSDATVTSMPFNLNILMMQFGADDCLDCAVLAGLVPVTPNMVKSLLMDGSEVVTFSATKAGGKITKLAVDGEDAGMSKTFDLNY